VATVSLARVRRYTWWMLPPSAAVLALVGAVVLLVLPRAWPVRVFLVADYVAVAAAAAYLLHRSLQPDPDPGGDAGARRREQRAWLVCGAGLPLGLAVAVATGPVVTEWALLIGLVAGVLAIRTPTGRPLWLGLAAGVLAGLVTAATLGAWTGAAVFGALVLTWGIWQTWWYYDVARQLERARVQSAELAVANERLRFAAELHDIQGHHLQVIALKSELAARLAPRQPAAAVAQMREVQQLAREALTDTRSLVGGYRTVSLATEIANATRVLAAADVDARPRLSAGADQLSGDTGRLLGLVVREATTNILRHARARYARIELDRAGDADAVQLLVANDGVAEAADDGAGSGLRVLAERLAGAGGTLRWTRDGDRFTVTATVPQGGGA
jgi:two-component system sensor histidine kinase DesK